MSNSGSILSGVNTFRLFIFRNCIIFPILLTKGGHALEHRGINGTTQQGLDKLETREQVNPSEHV